MKLTDKGAEILGVHHRQNWTLVEVGLEVEDDIMLLSFFVRTEGKRLTGLSFNRPAEYHPDDPPPETRSQESLQLDPAS